MELSVRRRWLGEMAPIRHFDGTLILAVLGLLTFGMLMVFSATHTSLEALNQDTGFYLKKQLAFAVLGFLVMLGVASFDYRMVKVYAPIGYGVVLFLLFVVLTPLGSETAGSQRWITLPGFQLQPSEFAKLAVVAMLAAYLSEVRGSPQLDHVWRAAGIALAPLVFVFLQPDVGTSMVFAMLLIGMLVVSGARARHIGILALVAIVATLGAFRVGIVRDYQVARLTAFIDPEADPLRAGYNKAQAEIAIGAGGITGRGYLDGTQTNLDFVPEQHTDFIFTVVGEELGFVGAIVLLMLYGLVLWRGFRIAMMSKDLFGTLLALGIVTILAFQVFVNIGMTLGIMPITGIPLPFLSYGGSSMITSFLAVGLLLNIHMRRFQ